MNPKYKVLIKAAEDAGKVHLKYFGKNLKKTQKSSAADFQTKSDVEAEEVILKVIKKHFPNYNILSEESDYVDNKSQYTFIIDPLDGTNNFALGIPYYGVCISLTHGDEIIFAVTHYPTAGNTYFAQKGKGTHKNNQRIKVNKESNIKKSTVMYTCAYLTPNSENGRIVGKLYGLDIKRVLMNWAPSVDYCLLAEGKIEAIINNDNEIYDRSAGKLIAREAGALITDFKGKKEKSDRNNIFLVSNGTQIHNKLLGIL